MIEDKPFELEAACHLYCERLRMALAEVGLGTLGEISPGDGYRAPAKFTGHPRNEEQARLLYRACEVAGRNMLRWFDQMPPYEQWLEERRAAWWEREERPAVVDVGPIGANQLRRGRFAAP